MLFFIIFYIFWALLEITMYLCIHLLFFYRCDIHVIRLQTLQCFLYRSGLIFSVYNNVFHIKYILAHKYEDFACTMGCSNRIWIKHWMTCCGNIPIASVTSCVNLTCKCAICMYILWKFLIYECEVLILKWHIVCTHKCMIICSTAPSRITKNRTSQTKIYAQAIC